MRKLLYAVVFTFAFITSYSQQQQVRVDQYLFPDPQAAEQTVIIEMSFGESKILRITGDTSLLRAAAETMIDIVCTEYPSQASLEKLNEQRIKNVLHFIPGLDKNKIRKINFLRQLDGSHREIAKKMFHGAVIRFRPAQTKETMKKDLAKLEAMINGVQPESIPPNASTDKSIRNSDKILGDIKSMSETTTDSAILRGRIYIGLTSLVEPDIEKRDKRLFANADSISIMTPAQAEKYGYIDNLTYKNTYAQYPKLTVYFAPWTASDFSTDFESLDKDAFIPDSASASGYRFNPKFRLPDSTIFNVFNRNRWKNAVIVGDVTGSMYPYTAQLLIWLKLHSLDDFSSRFAFFNDGDEKSDEDKKIGETGGIYIKRCYTYDDTKELVKHTMLKGGGGDCPENDIEALLQTEKQFPDNEYQVLIADNWAPIKDKILIEKLTKPVRVVLCGGTEYGINADYLNLARKTKGSVHLMEEDLYELAALHEGETIKIGRVSFKIVDGEFKQVPDIDKIKSL